MSPTPIRTSYLALLLGFSLAAGCRAHSATPFQFTPELTAESTTNLMAQALRAEGERPVIVDTRSGMVVTAWTDSGHRVRQTLPNGEDYDEFAVFRRYRVAVRERGQGSDVLVALEAKRCAPSAECQGERMLGQCTDMQTIAPSLQEDLNTLGTKLRQTAQIHRPEVH
jgi:hypothetical protein